MIPVGDSVVEREALMGGSLEDRNVATERSLAEREGLVEGVTSALERMLVE